MRRISRTEALCLRTADVMESSRLVTLFSPEHGRLSGLARGARRLKSRSGAALDRFAHSRVIYYWHQEKTVFTVSDAELVRSFSGLTQLPGRFLAAEQVAEFLLRTVRPFDVLHAQIPEGNVQLFQLTLAYFDALEKFDAGFPTLVASFLLKAASFLGFRPELRRCLHCHKPVPADSACCFDQIRGGVTCPDCSPGGRGTKLEPEARARLVAMLHRPAAGLVPCDVDREHLGLVLGFVTHHLDPLLLHSFRWQEL
jgi:DNA repair protein RecO (recombination protein O)